LTQQYQFDLLNSALVEGALVNNTLPIDLFVVEPYTSAMIIDVVDNNIFIDMAYNQSVILRNNDKTQTITLKYDGSNRYLETAISRQYYLDAKINVGTYRYTITGFGSALLEYVPIATPDPNSFTIWMYVSTDDVITLPISNESSSISIIWGDDDSSVDNYTHTYYDEGLYQIQVSGNFGKFGNDDVGYDSASRITKVISFGIDIGITSLSGAFKNSVNLTNIPAVLPNTITDISYMFFNNKVLDDINILSWDLSNITNMEYVLADTVLFNRNVGDWNISETNLEKWKYIYYQTVNQIDHIIGKYNQPITGWVYNKIINISRQ
jgi:surface protein